VPAGCRAGVWCKWEISLRGLLGRGKILVQWLRGLVESLMSTHVDIYCFSPQPAPDVKVRVAANIVELTPGAG
jgi:hypothetical protein